MNILARTSRYCTQNICYLNLTHFWDYFPISGIVILFSGITSYDYFIYSVYCYISSILATRLIQYELLFLRVFRIVEQVRPRTK